jgi:hypothetical protein
MIFYNHTQDSMRIQVRFFNGLTIIFFSLSGHNLSFFRLNTYFLSQSFDYFSSFFFMYLLSPSQFSPFPYNGMKYKLKDKKSSIFPNQFCIAQRNQTKILSRGNVLSGKNCNRFGIEF